jgi:hypothetical protein
MASDQRLTGGGTDGNERLTAAAGVLLLVLLAVLGVTIVRIGQLLFAWLALTGVHVLGHLADLPAPLRADYGGAGKGLAGLSGRLPGRDGRVLSLVGMLVAGVVLAVLVIPEFGPWVNGSHHH